MIVLRLATELALAGLVFKYEGWWFYSDQINLSGDTGLDPDAAFEAVPTGRFEKRKHDGALAEVYEVRRVR